MLNNVVMSLCSFEEVTTCILNHVLLYNMSIAHISHSTVVQAIAAFTHTRTHTCMHAAVTHDTAAAREQSLQQALGLAMCSIK